MAKKYVGKAREVVFDTKVKMSGYDPNRVFRMWMDLKEFCKKQEEKFRGKCIVSEPKVIGRYGKTLRR